MEFMFEESLAKAGARLLMGTHHSHPQKDEASLCSAALQQLDSLRKPSFS